MSRRYPGRQSLAAPYPGQARAPPYGPRGNQDSDCHRRDQNRKHDGPAELGRHGRDQRTWIKPWSHRAGHRRRRPDESQAGCQCSQNGRDHCHGQRAAPSPVKLAVLLEKGRYHNMAETR